MNLYNFFCLVSTAMRLDRLPYTCMHHFESIVERQTRYYQVGSLMEPNIQDIMKAQGTRLSDAAPWESYESEMTGPKMSSELAAQVAAYSEKRYKDAPVSSQTQEVLAESQEVNEEIAKQYQWLNPDDYADIEARIGRVMDHAEFITILRKAGVHCFYRQHTHPDKATLYWSKDGIAHEEVACWVQLGKMPELSIMNFDRYGAPLAERRRGWRTCLLQIILKGIITEETANKFFGKPREDAAFARYNSTLKSFRNQGGKLD
jgi:hypothetical protein